ncbi:MAG: hypothetical protein IE928_09170 [Gammaproteobacteria bacterium]|nr:hypothetical protein [Gammaproteobacteria bacterium]
MQDAYLDNHVTPENESNALEYVERMHPEITDEYHKEKLVELKKYQMICLENQVAEGDIFDTKRKQYRELFNDTLKAALSAVKTTAGMSTLTIPMERA